MALIKCPECDKEVSDKAFACIHCGFPLNNIQPSKNENIYYNIDILSAGFNDYEKLEVFICKLKNVYQYEGRSFLNKLPQTLMFGLSKDNVDYINGILKDLRCETKVYKDPSDTPDTIANQLVEEYKKNIELEEKKANEPIKCPRCGSTQITTGQRGYSFLTGFLGSNKAVNRCAKCGHTWEPRG